MSDTDEVTVTAELRDQLAGLAVSAPPPVDEITARGHARRRHRRLTLAALCVAGATAATALAFDVTEVARPAPAPDTIRAGATPGSRAEEPSMIRTAAYTIVSHRNGTVTLTINPLELFDSTALENDLGQFGIPALVTTDKICTSDPPPAGDIAQVESYNPGAPGDDATITIDPSAMPAGSELSFGTVGLDGGAQASFSSLIDPNAYSCASSLPADPGQHPPSEMFFGIVATP